MELLIGVVVGFVLGYGVREAMSRRRRVRARREREHKGPRRKRQAPKSAASLRRGDTSIEVQSPAIATIASTTIATPIINRF
jgi:hypothetical protein